MQINKSATQLFFLTGSSRGHIVQMVLLWVLPLYYYFLIGSDHDFYERSVYKYALYSRTGTKHYRHMRIFFAFLVGYIVMELSLVINIVLVLVVLRSQSLENAMTPFGTYFLYMQVASLMSGLLCLLGECVGRLFVSTRYAYPLLAVIWFVLIYAHPSIMCFFQPYTEYSLSYAMPILIVFLMIVLVAICGVMLYEKKKPYD